MTTEEIMPTEEISVYNLYDYVYFRHNEKNDSLVIMWDCNNKALDTLMNVESLTRDEGVLCNHYWVDEIKRISGWTKGSRLYLRTYYFYNGMFYVKFKHNTQGVYAYEEIDEEGFLLLRKYNDNVSYYGELERVDCIYNRNHSLT